MKMAKRRRKRHRTEASSMPRKMKSLRNLQLIASPNTFINVFHFWLEMKMLLSGKDGAICV
jgi:hypothetical protein